MTYPDGIDVSLYQGDITHALNGQEFCVVKVSQSNFLDPKASQHFADAKAANVVIGGYHYLDPQPDAISQARLFLAHADDAEFLALDVEGKVLRNRPNAQSMAREFIEYVHAHDDRQIGMYSSRGTWPGDCGADFRWVADYGGDPNRKSVRFRLSWTFWQYTSKPLDRDYFAGSMDDLYRLAGRNAPQPVSEEPMTNLVPLTVHRVVDIPAGTVLQKTPGGATFTTLSQAVTLGMLGATGTHYHVADGDAGVYVDRAKVTAIRTADKNVGQ